MTYNKKGFTIIEIMIVIMIIGVLAGMAFQGFRYLRGVKVQQTKTKLAALDTMIENYHTDIREYPADLQELIEGPSKPQIQRRWVGSIASQEDIEDAWTKPFVYTLNPRGSRPPYDLYSTGPEGEDTIYSPVSQQV